MIKTIDTLAVIQNRQIVETTVRLAIIQVKKLLKQQFAFTV